MVQHVWPPHHDCDAGPLPAPSRRSADRAFNIERSRRSPPPCGAIAAVNIHHADNTSLTQVGAQLNTRHSWGQTSVVVVVVVVVVVFVFDAIFSRESHWDQLAYPETQGLNSKEEAEKCRTELRKTVRHHATQPRETRKSTSSVSKCEPRKAKLQPEASTGHTSPFKPNGERKLQDSRPPQRRKCVKFVHNHQSTDANHAPTVKPSIALETISRRIHFSVLCAHEKRHLPKNPILVLISNTQTPGTMTARYRDTVIMHRISSAKCASTKERKYFQKAPEG